MKGTHLFPDRLFESNVVFCFKHFEPAPISVFITIIGPFNEHYIALNNKRDRLLVDILYSIFFSVLISQQRVYYVQV